MGNIIYSYILILFRAFLKIDYSIKISPNYYLVIDSSFFIFVTNQSPNRFIHNNSLVGESRRKSLRLIYINFIIRHV